MNFQTSTYINIKLWRTVCVIARWCQRQTSVIINHGHLFQVIFLLLLLLLMFAKMLLYLWIGEWCHVWISLLKFCKTLRIQLLNILRHWPWYTILYVLSSKLNKLQSSWTGLDVRMVTSCGYENYTRISILSTRRQYDKQMIYQLFRNHKIISFVEVIFHIKWSIYWNYAIHHLHIYIQECWTIITFLQKKNTNLKHHQLGSVRYLVLSDYISS